MDWNALKVFLQIADKGSLLGAANALQVNHSTVYRRLNALEQAIGGRLFERLPQGYELTALGHEMLLDARTISDLFDDLQRRIAGKDFQPKGLVKITAPNNLAYHFLPKYLAEFKILYPDIQVEILVSNFELNMNNRQADIAVRATSTPPGHLVGKCVREIGWSVYAGRNYLQQHGRPDSIEQLADHKLIGASGAMRNLLAFVWLDKYLQHQIEMRCDDLVAMSFLAQHGHGLVLLPDDQQRPGLEKLFAFESGKTSQLWLLTHPDLRNVERIKLLMRHLTQSFRQEIALS